MTKNHYFKNLAEETFGLLTILEMSDKTIMKGKYPLHLWKCRCECGAIVYKHTGELHANKTNGCAECMKKHRMSKLKEGAGFFEGTELSKIRNIPTESHRNKSGVRGVYFEKGKWRARLRFKGKNYNFGSYDTIEEAAKARKKGEQEIYGTYLASLN